jgi:macrodomain Ter protein organizer (MatP/YcbG family)
MVALGSTSGESHRFVSSTRRHTFSRQEHTIRARASVSFNCFHDFVKKSSCSIAYKLLFGIRELKQRVLSTIVERNVGRGRWLAKRS